METIMNVIGNGMKDAKVIAVDKALEYVLQHASFASLSMGEEQVQALKAILDEYKASIPLPKGTPKAPKAPKVPKEPKAPKAKKEVAPTDEVAPAAAADDKPENKPTRPPTAQALFVKEKKAALKAENPSMSAKDLQQLALAAWTTHKESLPKPEAKPKAKAEKPKKEGKPKEAKPKAEKAKKPAVAVVEDSDDEPVVFSTVKAGGAVMEDSDDEAF